MFQLLLKILRSPLFKLAVKIIASLASAILVVSGYILFRNKKGEGEDGVEETLDPEADLKSKKASVHFIHK